MKIIIDNNYLDFLEYYYINNTPEFLLLQKCEIYTSYRVRDEYLKKEKKYEKDYSIMSFLDLQKVYNIKILKSNSLGYGESYGFSYGGHTSKTLNKITENIKKTCNRKKLLNSRTDLTLIEFAIENSLNICSGDKKV